MLREWRLIYRPEGETSDLLALPSAILEGMIAGKYLLSKKIPNTVVIQGVSRKGVLAGAEVRVDREEAKKEGVEVATRPPAGRGAPKVSGTVPLQELMLKSSADFKAEELDPAEVALILYTSGTTGRPKGVMLTHNNLLAECEVAENILNTKEGDIFITPLPFFHIYGLAVVMVGVLSRGRPQVLVSQYQPRQLIKTMEKTKATVLIAIPTQYLHLLTVAERQKDSPQLTLRACISGAAPLPPEAIERFRRIFGLPIIEGYGLTESTAAVAANPQMAEEIKPGSIGLPASGIEMKIVNEEGKELPPGEVGEIIIKGPVVMKGYYNQPEETLKTIREGWLYTGDMGYKDKEGYYYITDRKKELIIKGGFNISPREVEEVICSHPQVKEAAVIGVQDKEEREAVKAYVVLKERERIESGELIAYCREHLAAYKVPKYIEFKESLPKSATGKVLKKELREGYRDLRLLEKEKNNA